jgi:hypothetical protein
MSNIPYQTPDLPNGKWISAELVVPKQQRKTLCYNVISSDCPDPIGVISWYGPWRGYAFFPCANTVYEPNCLGTISGWIKILNQHHRQHLKDGKVGRDG